MLSPFPPMMTNLPSEQRYVLVGTMPVSVEPDGSRTTPAPSYSDTTDSSTENTDSSIGF
jgi:hypothetical protein